MAEEAHPIGAKMHDSHRLTSVMYDPAGFEAVCKHVTNGRDIAKHMSDFWQKFAAIEVPRE